MSLGPAGASLNPEETQNFEDVCNHMMILQDYSYLKLDGEAVCRQRSAFQHASRFPACHPKAEFVWLRKDCNSCAAYDNILGNIREDERLSIAAYENGRRDIRALQEGISRF